MKKFVFALVMATLLAGPALADELLVNGGFEFGVLGPWYNARTNCFGTCIPWDVETSVVHSGGFAAWDTGNLEIRQDFIPTPGVDINSITLWINNSSGIDAVDFFYTDASDEEFVFFPTAGTWTFVDLTSYLNTSKTLSGISFWGCSPDCVTYLDDVSIQTNIPEPGTLVLLGSGALGLAGFLRRRF